MKKEFLEPNVQVLNLNEDTVVCNSDINQPIDPLFPSTQSLDNNF